MLAGVAVGIFPDFSVAKERARYVELLEPEDRKVVLEAFVPDLIAPDRPFRPGLRVKGVAAHPRVFEMTSDNDGRTTFTYGPERVLGQPHVIWRRIGTHAIFTPPPGP